MNDNIKALAKAGVDGAVHSTAMTLSPDVVASLVLNGDLSKLTSPQMVNYYNALCERIGLDPATQPFKLLKLNGKLVMYADKGATQQLSSIHSISHQVVSRERDEDVYTVTVRASMRDGRFTDEDGCVPLGGLKGADYANAKMKAMTKAKRRAVLALMGLGMIDESEIETLEGAETVPVPVISVTPPQPILPPVVTRGELETDAERDARLQAEADKHASGNAKFTEVAQKVEEKLDDTKWFETAMSCLNLAGNKHDKGNANEWGREAKNRLGNGKITQKEYDEFCSVYKLHFPPPAQQGLFDNNGNSTAVAPASTPVTEPTPAAPVESAPEKKAKRGKKAEDESERMLADIEAASKVSILFTLKGRVEKSKTFDDVQKKYFGKVIDAKITSLKVTK